jgi:hypothetical protein
MDAATMPVPVIAPPVITLHTLGDPAAAACEGDFCAIPDHHEQAVVNRRLDEDLV